MNIPALDNKITDLSDNDKQLLYDAMFNYFLYADKIGKSDHVAAKEFEHIADRAMTTVIRMRDSWDKDIMH